MAELEAGLGAWVNDIRESLGLTSHFRQIVKGKGQVSQYLNGWHCVTVPNFISFSFENGYPLPFIVLCSVYQVFQERRTHATGLGSAC